MGIPAVVGLGNITGRGQRRRHGHHRRHARRGDRQPRRRAARRAPRGRAKAASQLESELASSARPAGRRPRTGTQVSLQANIEFPEEIDDALIARRRGHRPVPHRVPLPRQPITSRPRRTITQAYADALRAPGRQAAGHPHAGPRRRQIHAGQGRQPRAQPVPGRPLASACACTTSRCSSGSFARSCGPASLGDVRIMFPMISTLMELRQAKMVLNDVHGGAGGRGGRRSAGTSRSG